MLNPNKQNIILAIDTSCDETAVAVTRRVNVLANSLHSQLEAHKEFGGVVPSIAKLAHEQKFTSVLEEALGAAKVTLAEMNFVAVTRGPGLAIALEVGIAKAKELATKLGVPLVGVNHMEGHLLSALARGAEDIASEMQFPALGLLVSGGHTEFVEVNEINQYRRLGGTLDDACGEAFDKCARMLGLPYPGGPLLSKLASQYRDSLQIKFEKDQRSLVTRAYKNGQLAYELPVPMAFSGDLNMSFSGLKTAVKQLINRLSNDSIKLNLTETAKEAQLSENVVGEIAAVFEAAAIKSMTLKLENALAAARYAEVWLGGGVVASDYFREQVAQVCTARNVLLRMPENRKLMTDNAGMIGVAAGLKLESVLRENRVEAVSELSREVQLANGIYLQSEEFQLLDRDPILSL